MILVAGITALFGRGIQVGSQNFIRVLTTDDARLALERISDTLRNSRNGDLSFWLVDAQEQEVTVLTNTGGSIENERIRYYLDGLELKREQSLEDGSNAETTVLTRRVRNGEQEEPIFRYFDAGGTEIPAAEATASNVKRISLTLLVDEDPEGRPLVQRVETVVIPRGTINQAALPQISLWPTKLNFPAPGTELNNNIIQVTITNPLDPTDQIVELVSIQDMNDQRRLATFDGGHDVHVNYQSITYEGTSPGWYAWVGPIVLGRSGAETYVERDKVAAAALCAAANPGLTLEAAHDDANCPVRTLTLGQLENSYRPILTYRMGDGTLHYVDRIEFTY